MLRLVQRPIRQRLVGQYRIHIRSVGSPLFWDAHFTHKQPPAKGDGNRLCTLRFDPHRMTFRHVNRGAVRCRGTRPANHFTLIDMYLGRTIFGHLDAELRAEIGHGGGGSADHKGIRD